MRMGMWPRNVAFETETRPATFETEICKNESPRDESRNRVQITILNRCSFLLISTCRAIPSVPSQTVALLHNARECIEHTDVTTLLI